MPSLAGRVTVLVAMSATFLMMKSELSALLFVPEVAPGAVSSETVSAIVPTVRFSFTVAGTPSFSSASGVPGVIVRDMRERSVSRSLAVPPEAFVALDAEAMSVPTLFSAQSETPSLSVSRSFDSSR